MFLGERRLHIERLVLAETDMQRTDALDELLPLQRADFAELFTAMDGLPVTIRLLDPPLHEFLPDLSVRVALAQERGNPEPADVRLLDEVHRRREQNPMLGLRGVRLGLLMPDLVRMQVRAIAQAATDQRSRGMRVRPEIMVPLVGTVQELHTVRDEIEAVLAAEAPKLDVPIGTMIELPRAALTASQIAEHADFFSFGTNDLTQTTWGFSRDDVEGSFFTTYLERGIFGVPPFESIDPEGIGRLVRIAVAEGRDSRPTSSSASAASTEAIPPRCASFTTAGSITCPAHYSGFRSRGWKPAARRSSNRQPDHTCGDDVVPGHIDRKQSSSPSCSTRQR